VRLGHRQKMSVWVHLGKDQGALNAFAGESPFAGLVYCGPAPDTSSVAKRYGASPNHIAVEMASQGGGLPGPLSEHPIKHGF
jgi:hypothetical protein